MAPCILIVDDEIVWARNLSRYLASHGFAAITAASVAEAAGALRAASPALLCLDLRLPDGDGMELLARLRAAGDRTPCLLVTGRASEQTYERAARLDAVLIQKPVALARLLDRIRQLLSRPSPPRARSAAAARRDRPASSGGTENQKSALDHCQSGFRLGPLRRVLGVARNLAAAIRERLEPGADGATVRRFAALELATSGGGRLLDLPGETQAPKYHQGGQFQ